MLELSGSPVGLDTVMDEAVAAAAGLLLFLLLLLLLLLLPAGMLLAWDMTSRSTTPMSSSAWAAATASLGFSLRMAAASAYVFADG